MQRPIHITIIKVMSAIKRIFPITSNISQSSKSARISSNRIINIPAKTTTATITRAIFLFSFLISVFIITLIEPKVNRFLKIIFLTIARPDESLADC